jgi:UDP-N-acetylglucosamine diphosphorylase / glucose-1-phosphate thymidylyltransferase / UDP-N-acetylgalactosamine diphosphorylase / glucosamine-1-phosphate N-acetyltransferase / galactosamine-1-phosphate N-acetyltransferase
MSTSTTTPLLIVLAGGASSRMWPLREKLLLRFGLEPLITSQMLRMNALGFNRAIVVASPQNADAIRYELNNSLKKMQIDVVVQQESRGMGDALLQVEPLLEEQGSGMPVYVTQVHDIVEDRLHQELLHAHRRRPSETLLVGVEMQEYFPGGYLVVDSNQRVTGIVEKPGAENRPSNLVNIVAHIHTDAGRLFNAIRDEYNRGIEQDDHYERAMDRLMSEQVYRVVPYDGPWYALKFPWQVLDVMDYFLGMINGQSVAESAFIAPTATLVGNVYVGANARVFPGASIVGPAFIGPNTIVGNNALVRSSMILDNCEVGYTTEVARSYVSEHCSMHACRVLDSVFSANVNFSAGCTTANLRIDRGHVKSTIKGQRIDTGREKFGAVIGQGAFLGVDVMTMPGVKIGEYAQVGPGTHVHEDIRSGVRIYVKQEQVIIEG